MLLSKARHHIVPIYFRLEYRQDVFQNVSKLHSGIPAPLNGPCASALWLIANPIRVVSTLFSMKHRKKKTRWIDQRLKKNSVHKGTGALESFRSLNPRELH